jgi:hypothetical protein
MKTKPLKLFFYRTNINKICCNQMSELPKGKDGQIMIGEGSATQINVTCARNNNEAKDDQCATLGNIAPWAACMQKRQE